MDSELPDFEKRSVERVLSFVNQIFGIENVLDLKRFEDGHFRMMFKPTVFTFKDEETHPSKSQWNTLKKRLKRRDNRIFIYKEHGQLKTQNDETVYFIEFGFFKYR